MENKARESMFANAARESFGSISRFAKDLYTAISENSSLSKKTEKASSSNEQYENKKESQERRIEGLLERSIYLNSLISRQFNELIKNLQSFINGITGGLGLGGLGAIAGFGVIGLGNGIVDTPVDPEIEDLYDDSGEQERRNGGTGTNFEGEQLSDDVAAPIEGAESINVEFSPGPKRPNPPSYGVVNAVRNAVYQTFGEGYKIVITSGEGEYGSERHRGGAAIDYMIVDPEGNPVSISDPIMRTYLINLGKQGIKGHGMGKEYMGEYIMHSDIFPRENYTPGMGPTWGDGWNDSAPLEEGQLSLRDTFVEASSGETETPSLGGSVRVENGIVILPSLEEFTNERLAETPAPEPFDQNPSETETTEPVIQEQIPETPDVIESVEPETQKTPDLPEPIDPSPVQETPEVPAKNVEPSNAPKTLRQRTQGQTTATPTVKPSEAQRIQDTESEEKTASVRTPAKSNMDFLNRKDYIEQEVPSYA